MCSRDDQTGIVEVEFECEEAEVVALMEEEGRLPLPPYIGRADTLQDRERYQTIFARNAGAVAAPTAGLHFSEPLVAALKGMGHSFTAVTLHVGLGTFRPVTTDDFDAHTMHEEAFEVSEKSAEAVESARSKGMKVCAVGTTVVRALESAKDAKRLGYVVPMRGKTRLLIQPGKEVAVADWLLTNFHLPRSTLLALVAAFVGRERLLAAYAHAIAQRYRFYSYGDAMLIAKPSDKPQ